MKDRKGQNNPMFGRKHTQETKNLFSKTRKGVFKGKKNPMFGKKHSEETKTLLRSRMLGTIWINNGLASKRVLPDQLEPFLESGWKRGRTMNMQQSLQYLRSKFEFPS